MANQPISKQLSYEFMPNEANERNDTLVLRQLEELGQPHLNSDQTDIERMRVEKYIPNKIEIDSLQAMKKILFYSGWTFKEKIGPFFNPDYIGLVYKMLWPTCFNINLMRDIPLWEIPVYIIQGDTDHYTDTSLAIAYFDSIQAPSKKLYLFENASHVANWEQPEKYRDIIINDVLNQP